MKIENAENLERGGQDGRPSAKKKRVLGLDTAVAAIAAAAEVGVVVVLGVREAVPPGPRGTQEREGRRGSFGATACQMAQR